MVDKKAVDLSHLFTLAGNCVNISPELSRFYLNKIQSSVGYTSDNSSGGFSGLLQRFCQHCNTLFNANNCRTRVIPKRTRKKASKKRNGKVNHDECCRQKGDKAKTLPRRFSHVSMLCKTCGEKSFYPGLPRTPSKSSPNFSTPRIKNTERNSTCTLSKSAKRRQSRQRSTLKSMLLSDERHNSNSAAIKPRLQDFLETL